MVVSKSVSGAVLCEERALAKREERIAYAGS